MFPLSNSPQFGGPPLLARVTLPCRGEFTVTVPPTFKVWQASTWILPVRSTPQAVGPLGLRAKLPLAAPENPTLAVAEKLSHTGGRLRSSVRPTPQVGGPVSVAVKLPVNCVLLFMVVTEAVKSSQTLGRSKFKTVATPQFGGPVGVLTIDPVSGPPPVIFTLPLAVN